MALPFRLKFTAAVLALGVAAGGAGLAFAQARSFVRIATGGPDGTYHAIGALIASAISAPPQFVVTPITSKGSVANISAIVGGAAETAFVQADVAFWAYTGTGVYHGSPKVEELRSIANLYPESVHLVVRKDLNVKNIAELKGKKVSLDEPGSGTLLNAKTILAAFGLGERDISAEYFKPEQAAEKMKGGLIDAFFFTGGFPAAAISELASTGAGIDILPIAGAPVAKLAKEFPFFAADEIPAGTYNGVGAVKTVVVGAHWLTSSKVPEDTIYALTKALWSDKTRAALDSGHAKGASIQKETALSGLLGVPLHPGAERFYRETGLLK